MSALFNMIPCVAATEKLIAIAVKLNATALRTIKKAPVNNLAIRFAMNSQDSRAPLVKPVYLQ